MGPAGASGRCGEASWDLTVRPLDDELRHLSPEWLYRAPLPRTKLTSPAPLASFDGTVTIPGREPIELSGWRGMIGHNWGSEHAARWIWLHGAGFDGRPDAWLDIAIGRVAIGGRLTPWVASGAISVDGRRTRVGGLAARGVRVHEGPQGCTLLLPGARAHPEGARGGAGRSGRGMALRGPGRRRARRHQLLGRRARGRAPRPSETRRLTSAHGGAFELGMRERDHGVPIAPFADG